MTDTSKISVPVAWAAIAGAAVVSSHWRVYTR
jgi:hypothetical protein